MKKEYKRKLILLVIFIMLILETALTSIGIFTLLEMTQNLTFGQMLLFPILGGFTINIPIFIMFEAYCNMLKH